MSHLGRLEIRFFRRRRGICFFRSCGGLLVRQPAARARRRSDSRYQERRAIFEYLMSEEGKGVVTELVWFNENRAVGTFDLRLARSLLRV